MAKVASFQVSSKHCQVPNKLQVVIYDNLKQMRKVGGRWSGESFNAKTYGVTNRMTAIDHKGNNRLQAIIRLTKDHVATGLVAHEVAHAAVYFFTQSGNRLHKDSGIKAEEKFCYLYGDLFHEVTKKLYKYGVWAPLPEDKK